jgi:hypothetical protein
MERFAAGPPRSRHVGVAAGLALAGAAVLAACGAQARPTVSAAGTPAQQSCAAVAAVLGNGPDESEDPVGYAETQILPLRRLRIPDATLGRRVVALSSAYQQFYATAGSAPAKAAVAAASARVAAVCPGVTS